MVYNKEYCSTGVKCDSMENYVKFIVLHTPVPQVRYVLVVQTRSGTSRRYCRCVQTNVDYTSGVTKVATREINVRGRTCRPKLGYVEVDDRAS